MYKGAILTDTTRNHIFENLYHFGISSIYQQNLHLALKIQCPTCASRKGAVKEEKFPYTQKPPHKREHGELQRGGHSNRHVEGKVERIQHRDQCQPALPSLRHLWAHLLWRVEAGC